MLDDMSPNPYPIFSISFDFIIGFVFDLRAADRTLVSTIANSGGKSAVGTNRTDTGLPT